MKITLYILLWLWQLPQNAAGVALKAWLLRRYPRTTLKLRNFRGTRVIASQYIDGGVSLGNYIFLQRLPFDYDYSVDIAHEYGHSRQSMILGWLYLFVVGIPSVLHNLWQRRHREVDYFDWYCERWADRLGGVLRDESGRRYVK